MKLQVDGVRPKAFGPAGMVTATPDAVAREEQKGLWRRRLLKFFIAPAFANDTKTHAGSDGVTLQLVEWGEKIAVAKTSLPKKPK